MDWFPDEPGESTKDFSVVFEMDDMTKTPLNAHVLYSEEKGRCSNLHHRILYFRCSLSLSLNLNPQAP